MRILKQTFRSLLLAAFLLPAVNYVQAQVTIGSGEAPSYGALLELKTQQAGTVTNVGDDTNITSKEGGLLLPRVKITGFTSLNSVVKDGDNLSDEDKYKLAGLMVYNINVVPNVLYLGVYVWNGTEWAFLTDSKVSSPMTAGEQPKAFSFYETGLETASEVADLEFVVNPPKAADGTTGTVTYQWHRLVGSNLHATIGQAISGATASTFNPHGTVIKGTTRKASNAGMHRFYCEATGSDGSYLKSDIVEVAVGCGAKDNLGEWISFMCFNLGATKQTIADQIGHTMTFSPANDADGKHYYIADEENLYGDLYQWGRIGDGHEKRGKDQGFIPGANTIKEIDNNQVAYNTNTPPTFEDGNLIGTSQRYPWRQVARDDNTYYGNFILTSSAQHYNWAFNLPATQIDQLWRSGRFAANDPCAKINVDGTTYTTYYPETNGIDGANTGWRTPNQHEWGSIFKGGTISGSPSIASANTWVWNSTNGRGYEIRPDGPKGTTTLFLPASGYRNYGDGLLYYQGSRSYYWSSDILSTNAYYLYFASGTVYPANSYYRGTGFALRCVKN